MDWFNLARVLVGGVALGTLVGKLVVLRPYHLDRLRPSFWIPALKSMGVRAWVKALGVALALAFGSFLLIMWFTGRLVEAGVELYSEDYVFLRLRRVSPLALLASANILPVFEEWVFRGVLLEESARRLGSRAAGVLVSAAAFSIFHLSNPGTYPAFALPPMVGGVILGVCYLVAGLGAAILCHCVYNSMLVVWG